jgi:hypothetical protein
VAERSATSCRRRTCASPATRTAEVRRWRASGGAGDGLIPAALAAGVDVLVTGDLRHHVTLDALELGLTLIDAGHHATEVAAMPAWLRRLQAGRRAPWARGTVVASRSRRSLEVTVSEPTAEQLDLLLELQATDHRIRKLEHQLDDLPEQRELEASRAAAADVAASRPGRDPDRARARQRPSGAWSARSRC